MFHWYCKATYNLEQIIFPKRLIIWDWESIKTWYFKNIHWDESNNILHVNICIYILVKKYDQINLCE